jgi:uncharacterized protein (TIGR00369 family)
VSSGTEVVSPAWGWLGIRLLTTEEGTATVEMTPIKEMANSAGFVHGGMISALADSAMGRSVWTLQPAVERAMSFDLKLSFISPARVDQPLRAVARVVHAGRRTAVTECRIEGPGGRLVATATGTFAVKRKKE